MSHTKQLKAFGNASPQERLNIMGNHNEEIIIFTVTGLQCPLTSIGETIRLSRRWKINNSVLFQTEPLWLSNSIAKLAKQNYIIKSAYILLCNLTRVGPQLKMAQPPVRFSRTGPFIANNVCFFIEKPAKFNLR